MEFDPEVRLLVLSPEDWAEHAAVQIYGMPHYGSAGEIFVGAQTADFLRDIAALLDEVLTRDQRAEVGSVYGAADGRPDLSAFTDLLVVHELGHLFHEQVPFDFPRLWLMELFANLCLHAYVAEVEPERLPVLTVLPDKVGSVPLERVRHRSLVDFERLYVGVGPENYCWCQFRLSVGARDIYDESGVGALRRLYRTFVSPEGEPTDRKLAELLEQQVSPVAARLMRTWPK